MEFVKATLSLYLHSDKCLLKWKKEERRNTFLLPFKGKAADKESRHAQDNQQQ